MSPQRKIKSFNKSPERWISVRAILVYLEKMIFSLWNIRVSTSAPSRA